MMIDVQIGPTHPVVLRHFGEQGMAAPLKISWRACYSFNHRRQRVKIAPEIFRRRATSFLIILSHRGHTVWPLERRIQRDPSHQTTRHKITFITGNYSLADDRLKRIIEMTNHLVWRHPAPAPLAVGRQSADAIEYLDFVSSIPKRSHKFSIRLSRTKMLFSWRF